MNNNNERGDGRNDEQRKGSARLFIASSILLIFTLIAAIGIAAWSPLIPEAAAVNLERGKSPFADYVILHESWHSIAASQRALSCAD